MTKSNQEVLNELYVPCLKNGQILFNIKTQYTTQGSQLIRINSASYDSSQTAKINQRELLNCAIDTLVLFGVQSEHARQQWQRLDHENKQLKEAYQQSEINNKNTMDKVLALIEQGIITQEQFDSALTNEKVR